ncbi:hypothetical protein [Gloeocapsa sp. PCC 73106]|uniref:hypothetical protein n=1 Tax=Gloeocapsa sp. PCC 73106 TaxID=102232 RepID=UPI0002ACBFD9|nr:hypothetical protein [Gloeocapsa sp. PCC 73106]ELR99475.1 hypothetical protein GLO73106DRAFT_00033270 [Gloeocapsa sp. PCC 73106]
MTHFTEKGLPGLILVLVALVQIYLTQTAELSPWKGGGFGMFGAIDSPSMRFIKGEGLAHSGERIELQVYSPVRQRSLPRQTDLEQIAEEFLAQPIVPTNTNQFVYRLMTIYDSDVQDKIKTLKAVRLQWWRLRFEATQDRLWAEPLNAAVEAGIWR